MHDRVRYLLLQVRNADDPMRAHEVRCFAKALHTIPDRIAVHDLLGGAPSRATLATYDCVLLGGSGDYSVAEGGPWLEPALDAMRDLRAKAKPTFASCWGFQALARALGGTVVHDRARAEVGTVTVHLTEAGRADPVFGAMPAPSFAAPMGHEDTVDRLPDGAVRLAGTDLVENQAYRLDDAPIYATQFHPELDRDTLLDRLYRYPRYVESIAGMPLEQFVVSCRPVPEMEGILKRFIEFVLA